VLPPRSTDVFDALSVMCTMQLVQGCRRGCLMDFSSRTVGSCCDFPNHLICRPICWELLGIYCNFLP